MMTAGVPAVAARIPLWRRMATTSSAAPSTAASRAGEPNGERTRARPAKPGRAARRLAHRRVLDLVEGHQQHLQVESGR